MAPAPPTSFAILASLMFLPHTQNARPLLVCTRKEYISFCDPLLFLRDFIVTAFYASRREAHHRSPGWFSSISSHDEYCRRSLVNFFCIKMSALPVQAQHEALTPREQWLRQLRKDIQAEILVARKNGTRLIRRNFEMPPEWMPPGLREYFSKMPRGFVGDLMDHDDPPFPISEASDCEELDDTNPAFDTLDQDNNDEGLGDDTTETLFDISHEDAHDDVAMSGIEEEELNFTKASLTSKTSAPEALGPNNSAPEAPGSDNSDAHAEAYDTDEMEEFDAEQGSDMDDNIFFGGDDWGEEDGHDGGQGGNEARDEGQEEGAEEQDDEDPNRFDFDKEKRDLEARYDSGERQLVVPMQHIFDHVEVACIERGLQTDQAHTIRFHDKGVDMTLQEILPIAKRCNDPRSWMYDTMVEYLIDQHGPYPPGVAFIHTGMNQLFCGAGRDADDAKPETIKKELEDHVEQALSNRGYEPAVGWPFERTATDIRKAVMAWNPRGNHWVSVAFLFDEAASKGRVEVRNSLRPGLGDSGQLVGTDRAAATYLRSFGKLMAVSPHVNLPHLTWDEPVEFVEQTRQLNTIDCGPIAMDTTIKELHGQPHSVVGPAEVRAFGLDLRTKILKLVYQQIFGQEMPVFEDDLSTSRGARVQDMHELGTWIDMEVDPALLGEQEQLLKLAAMQKAQQDDSPSGLISPLFEPKSEDPSDSDIQELEKAADGSFQAVSQESLRQRRIDNVKRIETMRARLKPVLNGMCRWRENFGVPLRRLLDYMAMNSALDYGWILGFEQMCRFVPPMKHSGAFREEWYSESMVNEVVKLMTSQNESSHFIPVQDVQAIISDDLYARLLQHIASGTTEPYARMAALSPAPENVNSLVFAWLALGHWTTVHVQLPQADTVGQIIHYDSMRAGIRSRSDLLLSSLRAFVKEYARKLAWPDVNWEIVMNYSGLQKDTSSCGPLTVENCVGLLTRGLVPVALPSIAELRSSHLESAFTAIQQSWQVLQPPSQEKMPRAKKPQARSVQKEFQLHYRELLCNALEDGAATEEELFARVRQNLDESYQADSMFDQRLRWYLESTPSTFASALGKWSLIRGPGHDLSSNERHRLEGFKIPPCILDVVDHLHTDKRLIIAVVRLSRGYASYDKAGRIQSLAAQLVDTFCARFESSKASPRLVESHQEFAAIDHALHIPYIELRLENVSSRESLLEMLEKSPALVDILYSLQGRVILLQLNPDGSSTDFDSYFQVLACWPEIAWDLMICARLQDVASGLLSWGVPDRDLCWFQLSLARLAAMWQGLPVSHEEFINNAHEQMLYLINTFNCVKIDYTHGGVRAHCNAIQGNPACKLFKGRSSQFEHITKSCHDCGSNDTVAVWQRGPSSRRGITLLCDRQHQLSANATLSDEKILQPSDVKTLKEKKSRPRVELLKHSNVPANLVPSTPLSRNLSKNCEYFTIKENDVWQSGVANISIGARLLPHVAGMSIRRKIYDLERTTTAKPRQMDKLTKEYTFFHCEPCQIAGKGWIGMISHYLSDRHLQDITEQVEVLGDPKEWAQLVEAVPPYVPAAAPKRSTEKSCLLVGGKPHAIIFICDRCAFSNHVWSRITKHFKDKHRLQLGNNSGPVDSTSSLVQWIPIESEVEPSEPVPEKSPES